MKAPPRTKWPPAGAQIRLTRSNGESAGLVEFVSISGDSLLVAGINRDAFAFIPLAELDRFEVVKQDRRPANLWGAA